MARAALQARTAPPLRSGPSTFEQMYTREKQNVMTEKKAKKGKARDRGRSGIIIINGGYI